MARHLLTCSPLAGLTTDVLSLRLEDGNVDLFLLCLSIFFRQAQKLVKRKPSEYILKGHCFDQVGSLRIC
jgi:hypothetical protein